MEARGAEVSEATAGSAENQDTVRGTVPRVKVRAVANSGETGVEERQGRLQDIMAIVLIGILYNNPRNPSKHLYCFPCF